LDTKLLGEVAARAAAEVGVVGAQVALLESGRITQAVTGTANLATKTPVTDETIFAIGSTTKVFNASLVMSLVDEGKLNLDEPVASYINGYRPGTPGAIDGITLRRLLSMTAGLDNGTYSDLGSNPDAIELYVREQANLPLISPPGTRFGYSNAGTVVAGHAAERVTGKVWDDLLRERVLEPAGLKRAETIPTRMLHHPVAVGHTIGDDGPLVVSEWHPTRGLGPAGGIAATAADLAQFAAVMLGSSSAVISAQGLETMHSEVATFPDTIVAQGWGVGPFIKHWNGVTLHGHSGTTSAGSSYLVWIPSRNIALATVVNTPRLGYPFADRVMDEVLGKAFGISPPPEPQPVSIDSSHLNRFTGVYVAHGVELHMALSEDGTALDVRQMANIVSTDESLPLVRLIPVGDGRFLPSDRNFSGGRGWAVAFVGDGAKVTHFLNGVFLARRLTAN
jgi:CubicO group peptidase (beta-lactamase class C family)